MADRRAALKTPLDPAEIKAAIARAWVARYGEEPSSDSVAVLMAQIALETGLSSCICWNLGNVKAHPGGDVDWCFFQTWERVPSHIAKADAELDPAHVVIVTDDGTNAKVVFKPDHPATCFRAFSSLDEGIAAYFRTMTNRFAKAWPAVRAGDPVLFAHLLKAQGYYTAAESEYSAGLESRFHAYADPPLSTVADVEAVLSRLGYTSVRKFQTERMSPLDVDGVAGNDTKRALRAALASA